MPRIDTFVGWNVGPRPLRLSEHVADLAEMIRPDPKRSVPCHPEPQPPIGIGRVLLVQHQVAPYCRHAPTDRFGLGVRAYDLVNDIH